MAKEQQEDEGTRGFAHFISVLGQGEAHADISQELHKLTSELHGLAKGAGAVTKGKLTLVLSLEVKPSGEMQVGHGVKITSSKPKKATSHAWVTKGGNVTFEHPRQQSLPLRDASDHDPETGEVRQV